MRMYYQAALAIIAAVSLISLLFYRHEYNKLRYVLEVFNYFGKPTLKNVPTNCTNGVVGLAKLNMRFDEPVSAWQRLEDNLYVYSAYSIHEKEVQAVGFGTLNSIKDVQCVIYFENEDEPILGLFKSVPIDVSSDPANDQESDYKGYHFLCGHTKTKRPVGITFLTNSEATVNSAPIIPVSISPHSFNGSSIAVCVLPPSSKQMRPSDMISFINFHDVIGMDNFIAYDYGIPNKFNSRLKDMSTAPNPHWKFTYTVLPWNFPFPNVDRNTLNSIIQADCLYRTANKVKYVSALSWEEYLVLKYHHSVVDLMADFNRAKMKADRYTLTASVFCTQQADNIQTSNSTLTIFRKTRYSPNINEARPIYIFKPSKVLSKTNIYTREISKDLVIVNQYRHCSERGSLETPVHDVSILRFIEDVQNSSIYRKFVGEKEYPSNK